MPLLSFFFDFFFVSLSFLVFAEEEWEDGDDDESNRIQ